MIQEITPHVYHNHYDPQPVEAEDYVFVFHNNEILLDLEKEIAIPTFGNLLAAYPVAVEHCQFLFRIDSRDYYLLENVEIEPFNRWRYCHEYRECQPMWRVFACAVAEQLHRWYTNHRFCGRCGEHMEKHARERALVCPACGQIIYPTIMPAVIVAVTDGDKLLLTVNANGAYRRHSLVAGYAEVGESLEQTVSREVEEEVGLQVKNIRYYKSQPWLFSDTLLVGYFCELAGSPDITLQEEELAEAGWFTRNEIPARVSELSLTSEMIEIFRNQRM